MRLLYTLIFAFVVLGVTSLSPSYAQIFEDGNPLRQANPFEQMRFWFEDRWIEIQEQLGNDTAREAVAKNEQRGILEDLNKGITVAHERIDRVKAELGEQAVDEIVEANRIAAIHEEFLEIREIEDPVLREERADELQEEINDNILIMQSCERKPDVSNLLDSPDYFEELKSDYCSKTLHDISKEQAVEILERHE